MIRPVARMLQEIPRAALVALAAILLSGVAATYLVGVSGSSAWTTVGIGTLLAVMLAAPPVIAIAKRRFDPFEPVYLWIAVYAFLYFAKPLIQVLRGIPFTYGGAYVDRALFLAAVGLAVFYVGYYSRIGTWVARRIPSVGAGTSSRRLQWVAWTFILLGFLGLHLYIQHSGGWATFWSRPHGYGGQAATSTAYLYQLPELMVVGFLLLFESFVTKPVRTVRDWLLLSVGGLGGVGIYTIVWGSRTLYSWLIIAGAAILFLARNRRPSFRAILLSLALLFVLLSAVPLYRVHLHLGGDLSKILEIKPAEIWNSSFNTNDEFGAYLAEVALVPGLIPYDYFYLHRHLVFHPIPRLIWHNKPPLFNRHWDEFLMRSGLSWGAAETLLGDFYAQLGTLGIVIGTFLSGIFWRIAYAYLMRFPSHRSVRFVYAMLLPNMLTFLAQSSAIAMLKWLPYMLPASVIAFLVSRKVDGAETQRTDSAASATGSRA